MTEEVMIYDSIPKGYREGRVGLERISFEQFVIDQFATEEPT